MNPATHKLVSQLVRLLKGITSALDQWLIEVKVDLKD